MPSFSKQCLLEANNYNLTFYKTRQLATWLQVSPKCQIQTGFQAYSKKKERFILSIKIPVIPPPATSNWVCYNKMADQVKVKLLSRVWFFATPRTDCSLPGSSIHGIFQARILEWVAISFSRGSSQPRDWTQISHIVGRRFTVWAAREVQEDQGIEILIIQGSDLGLGTQEYFQFVSVLQAEAVLCPILTGNYHSHSCPVP